MVSRKAAQKIENFAFNAPNWQNKDEYPENDDSLTLDQWKWEFLRRDEGYNKAWLNRNHKKSAFLKYPLYDWADPNCDDAPKFSRSCQLVEFNATDDEWQLKLHYYAMQESQRLAPSIFSISLFDPIEPQLNFIREVYEKWNKRNVPKEERPGRAQKKNNSTDTKKSRPRTLLLRVLDAHNNGVLTPEILDVLAKEEDFKIVEESSMRRTIAYAKNFWKQL